MHDLIHSIIINECHEIKFNHTVYKLPYIAYFSRPHFGHVRLVCFCLKFLFLTKDWLRYMLAVLRYLRISNLIRSSNCYALIYLKLKEYCSHAFKTYLTCPAHALKQSTILITHLIYSLPRSHYMNMYATKTLCAKLSLTLNM